MTKTIRSISLALGLAAIFATSSLNATGYVTEKIAIPFEFKVQKLTLPAGEYRVEREFGKYMVWIVNLQTGRRVQFFRDYGGRNPDRTRLVFETTPQGYTLKSVS